MNMNRYRVVALTMDGRTLRGVCCAHDRRAANRKMRGSLQTVGVRRLRASVI